MTRNLSTAALASINAESTAEVWLPMVVLTHDDWPDPIRLVSNTEAITHQGAVYAPFPFDMTLPDENAEQTSVVEWVAANASNELLEQFRRVNGPINGAVFWIMASTPDQIEVGPFELQLRGFEYDSKQIKGSLVVEPVLDAVFGHRAMDGAHAPGLF